MPRSGGAWRWSVRCWSAAVGAGVFEAAVHVARGERELAPIVARAVVYSVVGVVIWQWARGHRWAGWTLMLVLGTVGLASLLAQPLGWWRDGGDTVAYLGSAGLSAWSIVALRAVHTAAVLGGVATTARALASRRTVMPLRSRQPGTADEGLRPRR